MPLAVVESLAEAEDVWVVDTQAVQSDKGTVEMAEKQVEVVQGSTEAHTVETALHPTLESVRDSVDSLEEELELKMEQELEPA